MKLEFYEDQEDIKRNIKTCEGRHIQQVAYSSYHDALSEDALNVKEVSE